MNLSESDNYPLDQFESDEKCSTCFVPLSDFFDVMGGPGLLVVGCPGCGKWVELKEEL
jgi:hypothetical protein